MAKNIHELIKQESQNRQRNYVDISDIYYSQFRFVAHIIKEDVEKDHRRSVKLPSFGSFLFSEKAKRTIDKLKKRKDERLQKESDNQKITEG